MFVAGKREPAGSLVVPFHSGTDTEGASRTDPLNVEAHWADALGETVANER